LQYQNLQKEQGLHEAAAAQLNAIQADTTDYAGQIQKISDSLQNDLRKQLRANRAGTADQAG
jgi:hypothetical protein